MSRFVERPAGCRRRRPRFCSVRAARSSSKTNASSQNPAANELQAVVASFDVTAGPPRRFLIGLQTGDARLIGFGTVRVRVRRTDPPAPAGEAHDATFLPIPSTQVPDPLPSKPTLVDAVRGRGVYAATIGFDQPGIWTAEVDADVEGLGHVHASTDFQVATKHEAVAVGDRAPASKNYTLAAPRRRSAGRRRLAGTGRQHRARPGAAPHHDRRGLGRAPPVRGAVLDAGLLPEPLLRADHGHGRRCCKGVRAARPSSCTSRSSRTSSDRL